MLDLDLQLATDAEGVPSEEEMCNWIQQVVNSERHGAETELTVRVVDLSESQALNSQYRGKDKPTNVLSFPFEMPEGIDIPLIGDLVVCADIVAEEARQQNKPLTHHWAHMLIHGSLHLLGYDHIDDDEAEEMEQKERDLLAQLGIPDPYLVQD